MGSADFDFRLRAEVGEEFLRGLRKNLTPEESYELAKATGLEMVRKWNDLGCKSRVAVVSQHELHRANESALATAEFWLRKFLSLYLCKNTETG